jgi:hypothetical protein
MRMKQKRKVSNLRRTLARVLLIAVVIVSPVVFCTCQGASLNEEIEAMVEAYNNPGGQDDTSDAVIDIAAIPGVPPPTAGETPVTEITETDQYTGTVSWSPADDPFEYETEYTATITLTAKSGYTFTGVTANFFTVAGATFVLNDADSGVITAVFPDALPEEIDIAAIPGVTPPAPGETPVTEITETDQYTGTVSWSPADNPFEYETEYTATITLTAKSGYTLNGVTANFFTVAGAETVTHYADSGVVTAVFPATSDYLSLTYDSNGGTEGVAPTDSTDYSSGDEVTVLGNTGNLVGDLVGGEHTGSGIKQRFIGWNTDSGATTAEYVSGDTFTITDNTTLYAIYTKGTDVLRKVGPSGGLVFYDAGSTQSWGRYLEAAPASTEWTFKQWGDWGTEIGGDAGLTGIGDGQAATDTIVSHMESESITGTAAQVCDNHESEYDGTIYDDWFLPSRDELDLMYQNLHEQGLGGFADDYYYWSSSEYDSNVAYAQYMGNGYQDYGDKVSSKRVRAVRAF